MQTAFRFGVFKKKCLLKRQCTGYCSNSANENCLCYGLFRKKVDCKNHLPAATRVTSNAIYQRLKSYFGKGNCAVVHSSAFFFRKELDDTFTKTAYLKDRTFFRNVNVCTINQILTQGFNLGFWEIKTFHLLNAKVIIDEIHLYEPYTLGLIIATIAYLREAFNTQFYIMTATMPKNLKALLTNTLCSNNGDSGFMLIEDKELLDLARNTFEVREKSIDELEREIITEIEAGRKVLIVVNTVDEAIRLYQQYKSYVAENNIIAIIPASFRSTEFRKSGKSWRKKV